MSNKKEIQEEIIRLKKEIKIINTEIKDCSKDIDILIDKTVKSGNYIRSLHKRIGELNFLLNGFQIYTYVNDQGKKEISLTDIVKDFNKPKVNIIINEDNVFNLLDMIIEEFPFIYESLKDKYENQ